MGQLKRGSGRWGDRPLVGIGGDGGAATRGTGPESTVILPVVGGTVDSQLDSIASVPSYFSSNFDVSSPDREVNAHIRSTPGQARAANGGGKPPHSTSCQRLPERQF